MSSRTANFCFDAHDPAAQARWWAQVLDDFVPIEDGDDDDDGDEAGLTGPGGRDLLFLRVPEPKTVKNRMHICLRPVDRSRDEEVDRLLGLGATVVDDLRDRRRAAGRCSPIPRATSSACSPARPTRPGSPGRERRDPTHVMASR